MVDVQRTAMRVMRPSGFSNVTVEQAAGVLISVLERWQATGGDKSLTKQITKAYDQLFVEITRTEGFEEAEPESEFGGAARPGDHCCEGATLGRHDVDVEAERCKWAQHVKRHRVVDRKVLEFDSAGLCRAREWRVAPVDDERQCRRRREG
jgi:hypothetical protein